MLQLLKKLKLNTKLDPVTVHKYLQQTLFVILCELQELARVFL